MAKNITTFAPGMSGSQTIGLNQWYNEILVPGQGNTHACGPRNGEQGANNQIWKIPFNTGKNGAGAGKKATEVKMWLVNPGSQGAGMNCCGWGPPGASGAKAVFDLVTSDVMNTIDEVTGTGCYHICTPNGGCCIADAGGQQSCRWRIYNHDSAKTLFAFTTATCACSVCNYYANTVCNEVCYVTGGGTRQWDGCCTNSSMDAYYCKPEAFCNANDIKYLAADSDINVFKQQGGFGIASCCFDGSFAKKMVTPVNSWCTTKAHYISVGGLGYACNNTGASLNCNFQKIWGGSNWTYGMGLCAGGMPGQTAIAGGGNCYCGGAGGAGYYMMWYKQC